LDRGGSYDYVAHVCDFTLNHHRVPFADRHPFLAMGIPAAVPIAIFLAVGGALSGYGAGRK
jgi:hypothetical protein